MKETRSGKYARGLLRWIEYTIETISESQREEYRARVLAELKRFSFKSRKKGEPRNEGCVLELERIVEFDIKNPEHLAKIAKEGIHFFYSKPTQRRVLNYLYENL